MAQRPQSLRLHVRLFQLHALGQQVRTMLGDMVPQRPRGGVVACIDNIPFHQLPLNARLQPGQPRGKFAVGPVACLASLHQPPQSACEFIRRGPVAVARQAVLNAQVVGEVDVPASALRPLKQSHGLPSVRGALVGVCRLRCPTRPGMDERRG
ncbi:MAG: hypothetical protein WD294_07380 [Phycisphaeraceae bacterium]